MNPLSTLEAYDLLRHCGRLSDRLDRAEAEHHSRAGLEVEKRWLSEAAALVRAQLDGVDALLARARELPELDVVREDYSEEVQDAWVDALERLHAGLLLHAGSRSPILETLFPHLKFPNLRRASAEGVRAYAADFDRRSRLGYVKRILGQPDFAFAEPLAMEIPATIERWESCFRPSEMSEEDAIPLREELAEAAYRVERFMRQGRLLAEAALLPLEGAFDSTGIGRWPRRRIGSVGTEAPEALDGAPHDDGVPLAEALDWGTSRDAPGDDGTRASATDQRHDAISSETISDDVEDEASSDPELEPSAPDASEVAASAGALDEAAPDPDASGEATSGQDPASAKASARSSRTRPAKRAKSGAGSAREVDPAESHDSDERTPDTADAAEAPGPRSRRARSTKAAPKTPEDASTAEPSPASAAPSNGSDAPSMDAIDVTIEQSAAEAGAPPDEDAPANAPPSGNTRSPKANSKRPKKSKAARVTPADAEG